MGTSRLLDLISLVDDRPESSAEAVKPRSLLLAPNRPGKNGPSGSERVILLQCNVELMRHVQTGILRTHGPAAEAMI